MTVLAAIQAACSYLGLDVPSSVYGQADRELVELGEVANEAASGIAWAHDWEVLKRLETITGDGSSATFALPSDFMRLPKNQQIWSSAQESPMTHVQDHNAWLELEVKTYELVIRAWTKIGGEIAIKPTMPSTETAKYYYQSKNFGNDGSSNVAEFDADTDTFRLGVFPDRLLKLAIIWRYRAAKKLDYAEDMRNYEIALAEEVAADRSPSMFAIGRRSRPAGVEYSYPKAITA